MKITVDASKQQFIQLARGNGKSILSKKILDAWLISKETGKPVEVEFKFGAINIRFREVKGGSMVKLIKNGNEKVFVSTCMHCISDFSFSTSDIRRRVEYKYNNCSSTILEYATICPQCNEITNVFLTQFKD